VTDLASKHVWRAQLRLQNSEAAAIANGCDEFWSG
jgi:hypothetical protein